MKDVPAVRKDGYVINAEPQQNIPDNSREKSDVMYQHRQRKEPQQNQPQLPQQLQQNYEHKPQNNYQNKPRYRSSRPQFYPSVEFNQFEQPRNGIILNKAASILS